MALRAAADRQGVILLNQMKRIILICGILFAIGCNSSAGPSSVSETSAARPNLADRVAFVEQYVQFRRNYTKLEYAIDYQNNGGGLVPGPSEWNVRIVAVVPPNEVVDWMIAGMQSVEMAPPQWVANTAHEIDGSSITEWYNDGQRSVGIDRDANTIAYRNFAY